MLIAEDVAWRLPGKVPFLGVAATHRKIHFEAVDNALTEWQDHRPLGVGNLLSLMQQIGGWIPPAEE